MPDIRTAEGREEIYSRIRPVFPAMGTAVVQHAKPIARQLGRVSGRTWAGAGGGVVALAAIAWGLSHLFSAPKKPAARRPVRARAAAARKPAAKARPAKKT